MRTVKNYAMALVVLAIAMSYGLMSFERGDTSTNPTLTTVVFQYVPPSNETHPYDQVHVENPLNWQPLPACPAPTGAEDAPCSIEVPIENTVSGMGLQIDGSAVSIQTEETINSETFRVVPALSVDEYVNPINKTLP